MKNLLTLAILLWLTPVFGGDLKLDDQHSWIKATAHATGHDFTVIPEEFSCELVLDNENRLQAAAFTCSLTKLKSGKKKRDKEMWHWFEVDLFPELSFVMTGLKEMDGGTVMVGNLTLHDHTVEMEIPVSVIENGQRVTMTGAATIDTTRFGLKIIRKMAVLTVDRMVHIEFEMIASH